VPIRLLVRASVVALCAAGIVASVIARNSREQPALIYYDLGVDHNVPRALHRLAEAHRLNPSSDIDVVRARLATGTEGVTILQKAVDREPENAVLWVRLAQQQVKHGQTAAAQRSYARARTLDSQLPPQGPPPGD
jgi:predicted Zn-dependent protease